MLKSAAADWMEDEVLVDRCLFWNPEKWKSFMFCPHCPQTREKWKPFCCETSLLCLMNESDSRTELFHWFNGGKIYNFISCDFCSERVDGMITRFHFHEKQKKTLQAKSTEMNIINTITPTNTILKPHFKKRKEKLPPCSLICLDHQQTCHSKSNKQNNCKLLLHVPKLPEGFILMF